MSYFENNQKKIIFFTFLIICICCCCLILPSGLGFTKTPEINLNDKNLEEYIFNYKKELDFKDTNDALKKFNKLKKIVFEDLNIFDNNYTTVKFNGDHLKEDLLVAITTYLSYGLYATSYERVTTIIDTEDYFRLVLSACSENIIDGYYVIEASLIDSRIKIDYKKVQSLNNSFMKLVVGKDKYKEVNKKSVNKTVVKLFNLLNKN